MNENLTIAEAALKVLKGLGRPALIEEIYAEILKRNLYKFDTPTPEHVLKTQIRRHTRNMERVDASEIIYFEMVGDEMYKPTADTDSTKKQLATGMRRIQRATDKEEIIKSLTSEQVGVFKEIWRLVLFAAQVGFKNSRREPLKAADPGKGIDQSTFGNCPAWPGILYLMSLVESNKADCLCSTADAESDRITTFQEYANGGLAILGEFFADRLCDLDGILLFIDNQREKSVIIPDVELTI